jgi:hypothetical protein
MDSFKEFDPKDCDETLTRVVTHGGSSYLMFPFINATGVSPTFNSINCLIKGSAATVQDVERLCELIEQSRKEGEWFISFNTPWLVTESEADDIRQRKRAPKPKRQ